MLIYGGIIRFINYLVAQTLKDIEPGAELHFIATQRYKISGNPPSNQRTGTNGLKYKVP